jgi:hypothetical protein
MQTRSGLFLASLLLFTFDSLAMAKAAQTPEAGLWGFLALASAGLAFAIAKPLFPKA